MLYILYTSRLEG